jgi:hypothetical protein
MLLALALVAAPCFAAGKHAAHAPHAGKSADHAGGPLRGPARQGQPRWMRKNGAVVYVLPETRTPYEQFGAHDVSSGGAGPA